jgi:hypothetical protein
MLNYTLINHEQVLVHQSTNGLALVHYGLALKLGDKNMPEAVRYLQLGVDSKAPGTQHVRFYYHLGDAMQRIGTVKKVSEMAGPIRTCQHAQNPYLPEKATRSKHG